MPHRQAIIDIGSNTVRLVVYAGPARAPTVLLNEKVTARLGKGVAETGLLSDKAMAAALAALRRYALLVEMQGVRDVECVATAAARDARNGAQFLEAVREIGLEPKLLTGEEEAESSAMGVLGAFPGAQGVVGDLGGGSLELIHIDGAGCQQGTSLPFGTLRLPAMRAAGPDKFARRVTKALDVAEWHCAEGEALYLVGGSHRALARYAIVQRDWPLDDVHGFELPYDDAVAVCRAAQKADPAAAIPGVSAARIASLPDTAALLAVLLKELRPARLVFSSWGLREGRLFARMSAETRALNPLVAGVAAFTDGFGCPRDLCVRVADWTAAVDTIGRPNLRLAATMLALASQRVEPNMRGGVIVGWALAKRWIGLSAADRALLAACGFAHAGRLPFPENLAGLTAPEAVEQAIVWGLAVRLCRRLTALSARALADSGLALETGRLILRVGADSAALINEGVDKDLKALADRMGLEPVVTIG